MASTVATTVPVGRPIRARLTNWTLTPLLFSNVQDLIAERILTDRRE